MFMLSFALIYLFTSVFGDNTCTETQECMSSTFDDDRTYCYGYQACRYADIDTDDDIYCFGFYGCYQAEKIVGDDVYCDGRMACRYAEKVISDSDLNCDGQYGCAQIENEVEVGGDLYCDGDYSCYETELNVDDDAFCDGNVACYLSTIEVGSDMYCRGLFGCHTSTLDVDDSLYVYGAYGAYKSSIKTGDFVYAYGLHALREATINKVEKIYAYGFYSLYFATIDSNGEDEVIVYSYGFYAGRYAEFICQDGSECTLNCRDTGCYGMTFTCLSGTTCSIPNGCDKNNTVTVTDDGIYCPTYATSRSTQEDIQLLKAKDERFAARKSNSDYIETHKELMKEWNNLKKRIGKDDDLKEIDGSDLLFADEHGLLLNITSQSAGIYVLGVIATMVITWIIAYYYFVGRNKDNTYKSLSEN